jgi:hypothetical protein
MDANAGDPSDRLHLDRSADIARTVESLIARNRVDALQSLAAALDAEVEDLRTRLNRAEFALQHVAYTLAETPGRDYVETLLRLLPNRPFLYNRLRRLVAAMAANQDPETLLQLSEYYLTSNEYMQSVGEFFHIELMSLLIHEIVLHNVNVLSLPPVGVLHNKMRARFHPLAWLPMFLTELEDCLYVYLPAGNAPGAYALPPFGPGVAMPPPEPPEVIQPLLPLSLPPARPAVPAVRETTRGFVAERMRVAVANWYNMEARTFALEPRLTNEPLTPRVLIALGLESLERAWEIDVKLVPATPNLILARLFAVASTGGPHEGYEGAYGRLYAWQSLAALAGVSPDEPIGRVIDQVQACRWYHFDASTDWFYQVGWDIGIAVLRPGGETLAVLAATATD